jgi:hypothetical protein
MSDSRGTSSTKFDTIFVLENATTPGSCWQTVQAVLGAAIRESSSTSSSNKSTSGKLGSYFDVANAHNSHPALGATSTAIGLESIIQPYISSLLRAKDIQKSSLAKPVNVLIVTDRVRINSVEGVLVVQAMKSWASNTPPFQVYTQFFRVDGGFDAKRALKDLQGQPKNQSSADQVDTISWDGHTSLQQALTANGIAQFVLHAVVCRLTVPYERHAT